MLCYDMLISRADDIGK